MARRCDGVTLPDYYTGPTRRPPVMCTGCETAEQVMWDMLDGCWPTTAEWLAWVRRRDGRKKYYRRGWQYPVRPVIAAHRVPWFTMKARRLPAFDRGDG